MKLHLWQVQCNYKTCLLVAMCLILSIVYRQHVYVNRLDTNSSERKFARFFPRSTASSLLPWLNKSVEEMSDLELLKYVHWADRDACFLSYDFGGKSLAINERTGIDGQKTVCMDKGVTPEPGKCLVYSFGISFDWTFDDAMDKFGCQVYAFDPSMGVKSHNRSARVHFIDLGLGPVNTNSGPNGWKMRNLSTIYTTLKKWHGDVPIDVLKIDIEDHEWLVLPEIVQSGILDNVKQIAMEIHLLPDQDKFGIPEMRRKMGLIKQLEQHGMVRFALRPNPFQSFVVMGEKDHVLYELAWFNSKYKDPNPVP